MKSFQTPIDDSFSDATSANVCCEDRWQVYHRLQELEISCQCGGFQPLTVQVQTATEVVQIWSIVRRVSRSRQDLAEALMYSWRLPCHRVDTQSMRQATKPH